jgi:Rieske Fe-S protein
MKFMTLTSFAFTVGQFWIAAQNWLRRRRGAPELRKIATLSQIPVGAAVTFTYPAPTDRCILIRHGAHEFVAFSQQCTHLSCAVIPEPERNRLYCPCHEGAFDLTSGRPIGGPPNRPLTRVMLDVRGEDVYASGIEFRTV